jgi:hypothetical protein
MRRILHTDTICILSIDTIVNHLKLIYIYYFGGHGLSACLKVFGSCVFKMFFI